MRKIKIYVKAYTALNLGDDLFLKILFERYPNITFLLEAPISYTEFCSNFKNVKLVTTTKRASIMKRGLRFIVRHTSNSLYKKILLHDIKEKYTPLLCQCDAFISIGGSIFMEPLSGIPKDLLFYKYLISNNKNKSKYLVGCNFGPFKSKAYYSEHFKVFENFTDVTFRDKYSYDLFSSINVVRYCPDLVFSLPLTTNDQNPKSVGMSLRYRGGVDKDEFVKKHIQLITELVKSGFKVKLFSFCKKEGDELFINEIYESLILDIRLGVKKVFYNGNMNEFLSEYSTVSYMLSERFHSMIISLLYKQNIMPVTYSDKMVHVLEDLNFTGNYFNLSDFVKQSEENLVEILTKKKCFTIDEKIKEYAELHFSELDNFLQR